MHLRLRTFVPIFLLVFAAALAGCGSDDTTTVSEAKNSDTHDYPADVEKSFVKNCVSTTGLDKATSEKICNETFKCVEQKMTLSEFAKGEEALTKGDENKDVMKKMTDCAMAAGKAEAAAQK